MGKLTSEEGGEYLACLNACFFLILSYNKIMETIVTKSHFSKSQRTGADYEKEVAKSKAFGILRHGSKKNLQRHLKTICNG